MIGSVRASLPRVIPRNATVSARCIVTKSERWTPATVRGANLLEGEAEELSKVLPNIESHWSKLSKEAQYSVYKQLEELQRKDWKDLSINEQKGGAYLFAAFSDHSLLCVVRPAWPSQDGHPRRPERPCVRGDGIGRGSRSELVLRHPLDGYVSQHS